jgi:hypothetical protein
MDVRAPGDTMAMATMGADDVVPGTKRRTDACGNRFFPKIRMEVSADQPLAVQLDTAGFEDAYPHQDAEEVFQEGSLVLA